MEHFKHKILNPFVFSLPSSDVGRFRFISHNGRQSHSSSTSCIFCFKSQRRAYLTSNQEGTELITKISYFYIFLLLFVTSFKLKVFVQQTKFLLEGNGLPAR